MRSTKVQILLLALLFVLCFGTAAWLDPRYTALRAQRPTDVLSVLMGDSRKMFANHFFVKADAYFHSGFYPTIFDNHESFQTPHMAGDAGAMKDENEGEETAFMGEPRDFIERFTRHFMPAMHTHLDEGGAEGAAAGADLGEAPGGQVREILPWLQLSAELDPNRIETYMVTSYWLRKRMGRVNEAEQFLREGLRSNPGDSALLFELGRLYQEDRKNDDRARNLWELGIQRIQEEKKPLSDPDKFMLGNLSLSLSRLEESHGNLSDALRWLEVFKPVSPHPSQVQRQIDELRDRLGEPVSSVTSKEQAAP
jgi:hypothetical protein